MVRINNLLNNRVFSNIIALLGNRGAEYIISFITLPYLVRILGPEGFGKIFFAQSFIQYFILLIEYGFNFTGTKAIAIQKDKKKHGQIFMSIQISKFLILIATAVLLIVMTKNIDFIQNDSMLYIILYLSVVGNFLFPVWFFQGIQDMKLITYFNIIAKVVMTLFIYLLVKDKNDYIMAAFLLFDSTLIAGCFSYILLVTRYRYLFVTTTIEEIRSQLNNGWSIFVSTVAMNLYTNSNVFILGILTNNIMVGYYTAARKIINCFIGLLAPVSQALFPHVSELFRESRTKAIMFIKKTMYIFCGMNLLFSIFIFAFADFIVNLMLGDNFLETVLMLRVMSILPFVISISNVLGIQTMLALGLHNVFARITVMAAVLNVVILFPMISYFQGVGASYASVVTEIFVSFMCWYFLKGKGLNFLGGN